MPVISLNIKPGTSLRAISTYVIQNIEGQISDEIQKLATTLFIARTKFGS
jgi:hypothetical protein